MLVIIFLCTVPPRKIDSVSAMTIKSEPVELPLFQVGPQTMEVVTMSLLFSSELDCLYNKNVHESAVNCGDATPPVDCTVVIDGTNVTLVLTRRNDEPAGNFTLIPRLNNIPNSNFALDGTSIAIQIGECHDYQLCNVCNVSDRTSILIITRITDMHNTMSQLLK